MKELLARIEQAVLVHLVDKQNQRKLNKKEETRSRSSWFLLLKSLIYSIAYCIVQRKENKCKCLLKRRVGCFQSYYLTFYGKIEVRLMEIMRKEGPIGGKKSSNKVCLPSLWIRISEMDGTLPKLWCMEPNGRRSYCR